MYSGAVVVLRAAEDRLGVHRVDLGAAPLDDDLVLAVAVEVAHRHVVRRVGAALRRSRSRRWPSSSYGSDVPESRFSTYLMNSPSSSSYSASVILPSTREFVSGRAAAYVATPSAFGVVLCSLSFATQRVELLLCHRRLLLVRHAEPLQQVHVDDVPVLAARAGDDHVGGVQVGVRAAEPVAGAAVGEVRERHGCRRGLQRDVVHRTPVRPGPARPGGPTAWARSCPAGRPRRRRRRARPRRRT